MKQFYVRLFLLLLVAANVNAQTWQAVGPDDYSQVFYNAAGSNYHAIAIGSTGVPYAVNSKYGGAENRIVVRKYVSGAWTNVGTPGFSNTGTSMPDIAIDAAGTPYVIYREVFGGTWVVIKKFDGSAWVSVGSPIAETTLASLRIAFDGTGAVYIAYMSSTVAKLKKFDGSSWVDQGSYGEVCGFNIDLAFNSANVPYIACYNSADVQTKLKKFSGGSWTLVASVPMKLRDISLAIGSGTVPYVSGRTDQAEIYCHKYNGTTSLALVGAQIASGDPSLSIGTDNTGAPYIGISDYITQVVEVRKFDGTNWIDVGTPGVPANININLPANTALSMYNGLPYLMYNCGGTRVASYNGSSWQYLGITEGASGGGAASLSGAVNSSGTPYMAFANQSNGAYANVKMYNGSGWVSVGATNFSALSADHLTMGVTGTNIPYVVYSDGDNSGKIMVKSFNGSSWVTVGAAGFSAAAANYTSIAFDGGNLPYVVYQDMGTSGKATAKKFNGTSWVNAGAAGLSAGVATYTSLKISAAGTAYVAYRDASGSNKANVKKLVGSTWTIVGTANFSAGSADYLSLALDGAGTPYVAYADAANGAKATVKKFDGTNWTDVGTAGFSASSTTNTSISFDGAGHLYVMYSDNSMLSRATVKTFDGSAWTDVVAPGLSAGAISYNALVGSPAGKVYAMYVSDCAFVREFSLPFTASISVNTTGQICSGASVVFTANVVSGGTTPSFQWRKNTVALVGAAASTYTTSTLANNDAIDCIVTSSSTGNPSVTSNSIVVSVGSVTPSVAIAASDTSVCSGGSISFSSSPVNGGTAPGFVWKKNNVNIPGATGSSYTTTTLSDNDIITCRMTSNAACASPAAITSNSIAVTVNGYVTPSVSLTATNDTICAGSNVVFTAAATNGGNNPVYQWRSNGVAISGAAAASFSSDSLINGDDISVVLTSTASCLLQSTDTSNTIAITVTGSVTPAVSITVDANPVCAGTSVHFLAIPSGGGGAPVYSWQKNGVSTGTNNSSYTDNLLASGDIINCMMTSAAACASPVNASSNNIVMTIDAVVTPSVSIAASANPIITGTNVDFTATPVNEGTVPVYQWKKNGLNVGSDNSSYSDSNLANGDSVSVELTSNANCASPITVASDGITMTVNNTCTASITAGGPVTFCPGSSVTLSASAGVSYFWSNGATTQSIVVSQSGSYSVTVTNASGCGASALPVEVTVKSIPVIKIKNLSSLIVCQGSYVTLIIDTLLNTSGFSYDWSLNGSNITGATGNAYDASLGGLYALTVSDGIGCTKTSSGKTVVIKALPVASFTASGNTAFCDGGSVMLYADIYPDYTYKWLRDGTPAGSGDTVVIKKDGSYTMVARLSGCSDTSAPAQVIVYPLPAAAIITSDTLSFCSGNSALLEGVPTGAGYSYQWQLGSAAIAGANASTYTAADKGSYKLRVTDAYGCEKLSAALKVIVETTPTATITPIGPTTISSGGSVKLRASSAAGYIWQWFRDGSIISGAGLRDYIATQSGDYVVLITKGNCAAISTPLTVTQTGVKSGPASASFSQEDGFELIAYPNPVGDELTIGANGLETVNATIQIMDMTGKLVATALMNDRTVVVDMRNLLPGTYLVRYRDGERTVMVKLVKK